MSQVKVAHITTIDSSLRYLLLNQLLSLKQHGYEVIGLSSPGPEVPIIEATGIRHISVPMTRNFNPFADMFSLLRLYHVLRNERFTIVHTHTPKPGFLGQVASKMAGVPIIVNTIHGFYFHNRMRASVRRFYITLEKIAARFSDVILSQNREDIETAISKGICPPGKIRQLGNGIDIERFNRNNLLSESIARKRAELGLTLGTRVVGFVGRLVWEKGLRELFAAAPIVQERVPGVLFLMVGPEDTEKPDAVTPDAAEGYGIADMCKFTGMRQDMPELYSLMDILVLASHREGFPRTPMEASAMKVPCIVTDIRGCREVVEHGGNGLLIPLGDVQALAHGIIELLTNPQKARTMGEVGRRMALERFDEKVVFEKVRSEYTRLLREKGLPVPELMTK